MDTQINISNLTYRYSQAEKSFSLKDINLSFIKGEFISILGPNGSGKSTLLKCISGYYKPQRGKISIGNQNYEDISIKQLAQNIAFVPQTTEVTFPFSVYEVVMMGRTPYLNFWGLESEKDIEIVENILGKVNISHLKNKGINEISGGELQRASIARALVQKPKILLLDEPSSHLDIKHQISTFDLLQELNLEEDLTIIFVSHDLNLTGNYAKRGILMQNGEIFKDADINEILTEENIEEVFEVKTNIYKNENKQINVLIKSGIELNK